MKTFNQQSTILIPRSVLISRKKKKTKLSIVFMIIEQDKEEIERKASVYPRFSHGCNN